MKNSELLKYVPKAIELLKADISNLPSNISLDRPIIIHEHASMTFDEEIKIPEIKSSDHNFSNSSVFCMSNNPSLTYKNFKTKVYCLLPYKNKSLKLMKLRSADKKNW